MIKSQPRRVTLGNSQSRRTFAETEGVNGDATTSADEYYEQRPLDLDSDNEDDGYDLNEAELVALTQQFTQDFLIGEVEKEGLDESEFDKGFEKLLGEVHIDGLDASSHTEQRTAQVEHVLNNKVLAMEAKKPEPLDSEHRDAQQPFKRQRVEKPKRDGRMTDYFDGVDKDSAKTQEKAESEDLVWLGDRKSFKKGETWTMKTILKTEKLSGICCTLRKFRRVEGRMMAFCGGRVFISLRETFLGAETERLFDRPEWKEQRGRDHDLAVCANTLRILEKGCVSLQLLDSCIRRHDDPPRPSLIWDCGIKDVKGVGFNIAYRQKSVSYEKRELTRKPVVLELFSGCGGMGLGFKQAGFHVKYMVEKDHYAAATLRCNSDADCFVYNECVDLFLQKSESQSFYPKRGDIDHIHASAPCQGFSDASSGGKNDEKNNELTFHFVREVEFHRPRTASYENVTGIMRSENRGYLQRVVGDLLALDYQVRVTILDASDYGDAQARKRLFLFAAQKDCRLPKAPAPTHGISNGPPKRTCKDVLGDLESTEPVAGSGIVQLPDNRTLVSDHNSELTELKQDKRMVTLIADKPAPTIRRRNATKHYALNRLTTIRERARIQSFPDSYQFCGSPTERNNQIGNAVPINLARAVAESIMEAHVTKPTTQT